MIPHLRKITKQPPNRELSEYQKEHPIKSLLDSIIYIPIITYSIVKRSYRIL